MATITFAQALRKHRIAVTPVLRRGGSATWFAGQRMVNGDGLTNIIHPERKVEGRESPEEALRDLLSLLGSEDTLIGDDEVIDTPQDEEPAAIVIPVRRSSPPARDPSAGDDLIVEQGGRFFLRLPNGKEYQAARKRDLIRKAKLAGALA